MLYILTKMFLIIRYFMDLFYMWVCMIIIRNVQRSYTLYTQYGICVYINAKFVIKLLEPKYFLSVKSQSFEYLYRSKSENLLVCRSGRPYQRIRKQQLNWKFKLNFGIHWKEYSPLSTPLRKICSACKREKDEYGERIFFVPNSHVLTLKKNKGIGREQVVFCSPQFFFSSSSLLRFCLFSYNYAMLCFFNWLISCVVCIINIRTFAEISLFYDLWYRKSLGKFICKWISREN